ncbi:MAG: hypothetical protein Q7U75_20165 [Desulfobacterales bacterium]|nr:hypothetical protein [Desulfobacterales bacterium]
MFKWSPGADEVTIPVTVQPPDGIEPAVKVNEFASDVSVPPHPLLVGALKNVTPIGNTSVNDAKLAAERSVLPKVMVRVEFWPALMMAGEKVLLSVGGMLAGVRTVKVSLAEAEP